MGAPAPSTRQVGYRFGDDSGTTDPDTQIFDASDDIPRTNQAKGAGNQFFVRFKIANVGDADTDGVFTLRYDTDNTPSTGIQVTTATSVVRIVDDPGSNIADATVCNTEVLSPYKGDFLPTGQYIDASNSTGKILLSLNSNIELMFCIEFQNDAVDGQDYFFFIYIGPPSSPLDFYEVTAKVTIAVSAGLSIPVAMCHYRKRRTPV